jgi:hypothetical protein
MFLPSVIKFMENGLNMMSKPGTSAAQVDEMFYDTEKLSPEERRQAMALLGEQKLPEGSIFVMEPGEDRKSFGVVPDPGDDKGKIASECNELGGRERGAKIVELFLQSEEWPDIETVVLPGNASSPLGTAAFGKSVAEIISEIIRKTDGEAKEGKKVAAIVVGQGAFDQWMESTSGGMLMAPTANFLNAWNPFLEPIARLNPPGAAKYVDEFLDAMHDAATLYALLKARFVEKDKNNEKHKFEKLNMIVSHSKGNWAVLAALLAFELDLLDLADKPEKPIKVVTFCNPVALPDMKEEMKAFFQYFQFFGGDDFLAHNCSARAWTYRLTRADNLNADNPVFEITDDPVELMVVGAGHHLSRNEAFKEHHMPIDKILPPIYKH